MREVYKTSAEKRQFLRALVRDIPGSSNAAQLQRMLAGLQRYPISTAEAQRFMGIYDPPARVHQLRHRDGHDIETCWWQGQSEAGTTHRIGLYTLMTKLAKAKKGGAK